MKLAGRVFGYALCFVLGIAGTLGWVTMRDLKQGLIDAGNDAMGFHYMGQTIERLGQETSMYKTFILSINPDLTSDEITTLVDAQQGWSWFSEPPGNAVSVHAGMAQVRFIYDEDKTLLRITGECENLRMEDQDCKIGGDH